MFYKYNVRDCASSAKSFVIVFDDYEGYITVPNLPQENGVPVKINVILLRFPQANLFLAKIIVLDFTGACFDATRSCSQIVLPVKKLKRLSPKAQKIRVLGWEGIFAQIFLCRQNSSLPLEPQILLCRQNSSLGLDALHGYKIRHV